MSIEVMSLVFKRSLGSVTRKAVLLAMADAANDDGSGIWKSAETIAGQCDLSKRTVFRTWVSLEQDGIIRRVGTRTVRGGEVIIWGIDCKKVSLLPRASHTAIKPDDILSPGDTVSPLKPDDILSPGDTVSLDPVTACHKPDDTVSPEPSYNHPIEPSTACVRDAVSKILDLIPANKRRMAPQDSLPKVVKTILRTTPPEQLLAAVRACYSFDRHVVEEGQFAPAIYTFLQKGAWKGWQDVGSETSETIDIEKWRSLMRNFVDSNSWPAFAGPRPGQDGCQAPVEMLEAWNKHYKKEKTA